MLGCCILEINLLVHQLKLLHFFNDLKRSINLEIIKIRVLEIYIFCITLIFTETVFIHYWTGIYSPEMIHYNANVGLRITIFAFSFY